MGRSSDLTLKVTGRKERRHVELNEGKERIYDRIKRRKGIPEDKTRCVAEVEDSTGWHLFQCSRKRGYGPNGEYCKQHAKILMQREGPRKTSSSGSGQISSIMTEVKEVKSG